MMPGFSTTCCKFSANLRNSTTFSGVRSSAPSPEITDSRQILSETVYCKKTTTLQYEEIEK